MVGQDDQEARRTNTVSYGKVACSRYSTRLTRFIVIETEELPRPAGDEVREAYRFGAESKKKQ